MRRLLTALAVLGFLAALPLMHLALAAPMDKELVCHIDGVDPIDPTILTAHVIDVSGNAVAAHLAHGDVLVGDAGLVAGDDCSDLVNVVPVP